MKYIIMAGGNYQHWEKPRHLSIIRGEEVIARTIRLLRENNIKDISISSNNPVFKKFNVPVLEHNNSYSALWHKQEGDWLDCFYPSDEPVCYLLGDVVYSNEAIKKIVETDTDDIELFGSSPPFSPYYIKNHIEAFALKVVNIKHFKQALEKTRKLGKENKFIRKPIIWELWTIIKDNPIQKKGEDYICDYTCINDYTCDIDWNEDIEKFNKILGGEKMIKVEVIEKFSLKDYDKIKNIKRKNVDEYGNLFVGDTFECDEKMADYLTGNNTLNKVVVKVIEIIPDVVEAKVEEKKVEEIKTTTKKTTKKKTSKR